MLNHKKMIARRVSKGFSATESAEKLNEIYRRHEVVNLYYALAYHAFISDYEAEKLQMEIQGESK